VILFIVRANTKSQPVISVLREAERADRCCGSQTSLAWLANISFRGLRFADTIRTCRLAFAANRLRCIVTGAHTSGEGSPSVPMAVCSPYGQHTLGKKTPTWHTVCGRDTRVRASARGRWSPRVACWRRGAPKPLRHDGVRWPGAVGPAWPARMTAG